MPFDWTQGALAEGLRLYRAGEYFAAHEAWESVWLATPEPEKALLQGIIQVTAAFEHQRRGNALGIARLLTNALTRLDRFPAVAAGLDLATLRADIRACLAALAQTEPVAQLAPPRILPL